MNEENFPFGSYDIEVMNLILKEADRDPLLAGFVFPDDSTKKRLPIFFEDRLVGFATPRTDKDGVWRMGAIYVNSEYRNKGLARAAIASFMKNRKGRAFIEFDNLASQKAYAAAGFKIVKSDYESKGNWWEN